MRIAPVSLKHVLKDRPMNGFSIVRTIPPPLGGWTKDTIVRPSSAPLARDLTSMGVPSDHEVVQEILHAHANENRQWTSAMLRTFDRLSAMCCSHLLSDRARGKVWLEKFIEKHGRHTCDAMLQELRKRDAEAWFAKAKREEKRR